MPAKKNNSKKTSSKKAITKKISAKKRSSKKFVSKKTIPQTKGNKKAITKVKVKKAIPKIIPAVAAAEEIPADIDCMCMQKKPNGKFYNFRLQQGRWVQASAIPFPTKESCEEACC